MERRRVAAIPDGTYTATGHLDNDAIDLETPLKVTVRVTVDGEQMSIDLTDCADQTTGPVNCGRSQAISAARRADQVLHERSFGTNAPLTFTIATLQDRRGERVTSTTFTVKLDR